MRFIRKRTEIKGERLIAGSDVNSHENEDFVCFLEIRSDGRYKEILNQEEENPKGD